MFVRPKPDTYGTQNNNLHSAVRYVGLVYIFSISNAVVASNARKAKNPELMSNRQRRSPETWEKTKIRRILSD